MQPIQINDSRLGFKTPSMSELLPPYAEIPPEFKDFNGHNKWLQTTTDWFFCGLTGAQWTPKEGIDTAVALRHLSAIMWSWEPKHEHKEAGVAYLMSQWFDDVTYEKGKPS